LPVSRLEAIVDSLQAFYGALAPPPRDPFTLFVWEVLSAHSTPRKRDAALAAEEARGERQARRALLREPLAGAAHRRRCLPALAEAPRHHPRSADRGAPCAQAAAPARGSRRAPRAAVCRRSRRAPGGRARDQGRQTARLWRQLS